MASKTTNYGLHKFDLTDSPPDITAINDSMDKIDAELKKKFENTGVLPVENGGTGKATADEAFGSLGKNFGFPNAKNVGDNTDLNTLTKSGFYFSAGSKNTTNTTNIPQLVYDNINSYYELNILVFGLANRVTQIAVYPYNNSTTLYERMWVRTGTGTSVDSLSWSDWKEIFNSKRYIPIANGGTGAGTADTAREYLNAQRRIAQYVSGDGADLDTDVFDFIITTLTNTKHKALRDLGFGNFAYVWQYFYSGASNTTNRVQFAKGYITDKIATRCYNSSTSKWSDWNLIITNENLKTIVQDLIDKGEIHMEKQYIISDSGMTTETFANNVSCIGLRDNEIKVLGKFFPQYNGLILVKTKATNNYSNSLSLHHSNLHDGNRYGSSSLRSAENYYKTNQAAADKEATMLYNNVKISPGTILNNAETTLARSSSEIDTWSQNTTSYSYKVLMVQKNMPVAFYCDSSNSKSDSGLINITLQIMYKVV